MTRPYEIIPRFTPIITQCPREDGCDGIFTIFAYLEVTGSYYTIPPTSHDPKKYNVKGTILAQQVVIPFALNTACIELPEGLIPIFDPELDVCNGQPLGKGSFSGSHPETITENFPRTTITKERYYSRIALPTSTIIDAGNYITGTADFIWSTNLFPITGAAQTNVAGTPIPIIGEPAATLQAGAIVNAGGSNYPLKVGWEIHYSRGRCDMRIIPKDHPNLISNSSSSPNAKDIFDDPSAQKHKTTEA